jgi:hypothetical protein
MWVERAPKCLACSEVSPLTVNSVSCDEQGDLVVSSDLHVLELPFQHPLQVVECVRQVMHNSLVVILLKKHSAYWIMAGFLPQNGDAIENTGLRQIAFQISDRCLFIVHRARQAMQNMKHRDGVVPSVRRFSRRLHDVSPEGANFSLLHLSRRSAQAIFVEIEQANLMRTRQTGTGDEKSCSHSNIEVFQPQMFFIKGQKDGFSWTLPDETMGQTIHAQVVDFQNGWRIDRRAGFSIQLLRRGCSWSPHPSNIATAHTFSDKSEHVSSREHSTTEVIFHYTQPSTHSESFLQTQSWVYRGHPLEVPCDEEGSIGVRGRCHCF